MKVIAVVIVYYPDQQLLHRLLQALTPQVASIVVLNNGPDFACGDLILSWPHLVVHSMGTNVGVAAALNEGFAHAQRQQADFVVSFDQDSEPYQDMVSQLVSAHESLVRKGCRVGGVGPARIDPRTGRRATFLFPIRGWRKRFVPEGGQLISVDHLISSGFLVSVPVWLEVGRFLDELFVDYVDVEWCLRARHQGRKLYVASSAMLVHRIGDRLSLFLGREVPLHGALRHYTLFRNGVYLQKLSHISLRWKLVDAFYLFGRMVYYTWAADSKWAMLQLMLRGGFHGYIGRMGRPDIGGGDQKDV